MICLIMHCLLFTRTSMVAWPRQLAASDYHGSDRPFPSTAAVPLCTPVRPTPRTRHDVLAQHRIC